MKAIRVTTPGGVEALDLVDTDRPRPGAGEVLVRLAAAGVNYIDIYHRTGFYKVATPFTPGSEGAGIVEQLGDGVTDFAAGDRVAYAMVLGSYAEYHVVPAAKLVRVPDWIELDVAAAVMLQGMTAHYLIDGAYHLTAGKTALVHAAAGGVGGLLVQMAKQRGARVLATASTAKLDIVRGDGADEVIDYTRVSFKEEVLRLTNGTGVDVVYDSVGKTTFDDSLDCVARRGSLVTYGQSSGPVPPFDPLRLGKNGVFLTRPSLAHYTATRDELLWRAASVFDAVKAGLRVRIDRRLPLADAKEAHLLLESRATAGKLLLVP